MNLVHPTKQLATVRIALAHWERMSDLRRDAYGDDPICWLMVQVGLTEREAIALRAEATSEETV